MTNAGDRYDVIGRSYTTTRQEDPRIAEAIRSALGPGRSVVNVGAGAGSYEPPDREVVAVEPSLEMLGQRPPGKASAIRGVAEHLPFPDRSFDVAMAVLTVHHWSDPAVGLRELSRVADRQVVLFFEPLRTHGFWALRYWPTALELPTEIDPPGAELLSEHLRVREVRTVLVPNDCRDGFGTAFWARPEAYLDPQVQAGMSWLAMLPEADRRDGTARLAADLDSGAWDREHGHLRDQAEYDGGYRIAIAH
jgi:SAM-dependent methyltransferase